MLLRDVSIGYDHTVVQTVNAEFNAGDFVCLIGRNGSGKSTLIRSMAGLLPLRSGDVLINDRSLTSYSPQVLSRLVSLVLTQLPDLPNTTLREFVAYGRLPYSSWLGHLKDEDYDIADHAIEQMQLGHLKHNNVMRLSDGEKQKGLIARALAQGTEYMLLDEPSAFLDYESRIELLELLRSVAHDQHKAVLLSTHDRHLALQYTDQVWTIENKLFYKYETGEYIARHCELDPLLMRK
ncbi:MAG: ABC transporter ATP-binding protein [Bacteroidales bacterium]|nr:ABC transporter ATP-binding protein [Candidatus Liminaster caballi]